ncbi:MAG: tRNA (adenosine(37)-N6)-dimethylallyltransferase MiaA [Actinomycetota bacterium]
MATRVAAIVGPTAAGKSAAAVEVAERLGAEIVSIDSMQVYRGMDVGTDKATLESRARVVHHLLDVRPSSHELTVAEFQSLARAAVADIAERGRLPLLVGGSGLYFRAVVDELRFPPRSPDVRTKLEAEAAVSGPQALYERLVRLDPVAAARIAPRNVRRIVRALEVIELTDQPFSDNDLWGRFESIYDLRAAGITVARDDLYERIAQRVDRMLAEGLLEEVARLQGPGMSATARQALGYRQVLEAPEGSSTEDVRAAMVAATKRFARRQESWFRADPRVVWFEAASPRLADDLAGYLLPSRRGVA